MDSRSLQELRDVYAKLSHQSTGPDASTSNFQTNNCNDNVALLNPSPAAAAQAAVQATSRKRSYSVNSDLGAGGKPIASAGGGGLWINNSNNSTNSSAFLSNDSMLALAAPSIRAAAAAAASAASAASAAAAVAAADSPAATAAPTAAPTLSLNALNTVQGSYQNDFIGARLLKRAGQRIPTSSDATPEVKAQGFIASATRAAGDGVGAAGGGVDGAGDGGGEGLGGGASANKRRRKSKNGARNSFYPRSYFEWTDELMAHDVPERSTGAFVASVFELGLKHSSPKVLMKLMPPKADRLTTEHIKSRLQKYRLHAHRSKDEFLEFFNLRLKAKYTEFLEKEGWRNLSSRHGDEDEAEAELDGGGDDEEGGGTGNGDGGEGAAGSESEQTPAVKVDGQTMGDIRDLSAQCVREQFRLQEVIRHHISAQLKLQADIHEHLTTAAGTITAPSNSDMDDCANSITDSNILEGCHGNAGGDGDGKPSKSVSD